jgi:hypothetical protein
MKSVPHSRICVPQMLREGSSTIVELEKHVQQQQQLYDQAFLV